MLAVISSYLTPTVLFCLMNLMVATIFLSHKSPKPDPDPSHPLARSPSLLQRARSINFNNLYNTDTKETPSLLERARSINFNNLYNTDSNGNLTRAPSILERVRSINFGIYNSETHYQESTHHHLDESPSLLQRVRSIKFSTEEPEVQDESPFQEANAVSSPMKMRKSASEKMDRDMKAEADEEVWRPATARETKTKEVFGEDQEVDEKADDFINKFRQQLKLQRMDSILRFKEMLTRGASV